ncbi:MAG: Lpg1974 family pore-forming outer membrane protein [Chlamydiales bacterium]|nr:Lpg1974 family pore-forming outer membrane protein [Chlamydiales bacterium]
MKALCFFFLCSVINPLLATSTPPPPPPPFDADLFRKEEQVVSGHLEFLYWTIEEGALDYALKMNSPAWGNALSDANYAQGHFQTAGYSFDPGMRLAFSFFRASRYWEVKWQYTRVTFRGSDEATAPTGTNEFLTATWPQIISSPLTKATSHLHFNYNVFDALLSRVFHPNPHLRIKMIGGPTAAWMSQQWIVHYLNGGGDNSRLNNQWSYAAGGLKLGTTVDWFWSTDFYVTATGFAGLFMGSYHNQSKQTASTAPAGAVGSYDPSIPLKNAKLENIRASFTAQMSLGPSWQKNFEHSRVEAFAGYEITIWTNLQELYRSTAGAPSASKQTWLSTSLLALHGISIRTSVDF